MDNARDDHPPTQNDDLLFPSPDRPQPSRETPLAGEGEDEEAPLFLDDILGEGTPEPVEDAPDEPPPSTPPAKKTTAPDEAGEVPVDDKPVRDTGRPQTKPAQPPAGEPVAEEELAPLAPAELRDAPNTPAEEGPSSLLLLDDELFTEDASPAEESRRGSPDEEPAPLDFGSQPGAASVGTPDLGADAAPDEAHPGEVDLPSLLLLDESELVGDSSPDALAGDGRDRETAPADEPAAPPPLLEEADDSLPGLLLIEADEASVAPDRPAEKPPPPVDDVDIRITPIEEEASVESTDRAPVAPPGAPDSEPSPLLLAEDEEADSGVADLETAAAPPERRTEKPEGRRALLADFGSTVFSGVAADERPPTPSSDTDPGLSDDAIAGQSSLLLGSDLGTAGSSPSAPPVEGKAKRQRRRGRRERVRIVPPKPGRKIEWFSNPDACTTYCQKHKRPLLIYFSTGDVGQCHTYEEAIRMPEAQAFLAPYVCCLADLRHAVSRQAAERYGLPTDSPSMIVLSPSGREFARILKPEVDWQFVATMLFWALR